jgi:hypothetical protein
MIGGVLMISGARYIGFDTTTAPLYVATGLMSIVYGLYIIALRTKYRRDGEDLKNTWHA